MPKSISKSVIVITGASSGMGRATAQELAHRGATVVVAARRATLLEEVASEIQSQRPLPILPPLCQNSLHSLSASSSW